MAVDPRAGGPGWAPGLQAGRPDDGAYTGATEDAEWVEAARSGDERAFGRLFDRWFDPVYDIAFRIVRDPDTAAEVAQDVFLAAWQGLDGLEQPGSFGGWVRRIARNRALNRLDRERRSVPDGEQAAATLDRAAPDVDLTAALGEREQRELVWAAASALGERDASVLDLHLRHGLGAAEIAGELGVTPNNAHQLLFRLKGKLGGAIRAWVLWRGAGRGCGELDRAISDAGLTTFGPEAVRVIGRHAQGCAGCSERQELRLAPEALFAAMPIVAAPPLLKAEAAAALGRAGVPMAGSSTGISGDGDAGGAAGGDDAADPAGGETAQLAAPEGTGGESPPGPPGKRRPRGLVTAAVAGVGALVAVIVLVVVASRSGGDGVDTALSVPSTTDAPSTPSTSPAEPAAPPKPAPDAPTTASAAPATTAASPETTSLPDTTASTSSTSTSAVPAVPPTIDRFAATPPVRSACSSAAGAGEVTVSWASDGASATLSGPGGTTMVPPSGSAVRCARSGDTFTLVVASQEGATATATATVPGP